MSVLAVADLTTVARPAPVRPAYSGRPHAARLRPVPDVGAAATVHRAAEPITATSVTVTISIDGGSLAGRDRVLAAVRDLVAAAGAGATIAFAAPVKAAVRSETAPADGVISIDPRPRTVDRNGWPLRLSRLEYDLLLFLAQHPRQVFSRSQLLAQVWGHTHTTARTVDVHISRLRTKLGDQDLITTVYGLGYRLADEAAIAVADQ